MVKKPILFYFFIFVLMISLAITCYQKYQYISYIGEYWKNDLSRVHTIVKSELNTLYHIKNGQFDPQEDNAIIRMSSEFHMLFSLVSGNYDSTISFKYKEIADSLDIYAHNPTLENLNNAIEKMEQLESKLSFYQETWNQSSSYRIGKKFVQNQIDDW